MFSHVARLRCHQCKIQHCNALNMLKSIERYRTHPSHIFEQLDKTSYGGSGTSADQRNQTMVSFFGQGWATIRFYILGLGAPFSELWAPSTARFSFLWFHILSESYLFSRFCRHSEHVTLTLYPEYTCFGLLVVIVHFHSTIKIHQHNRLREFVNRFNENQIQKN